MSAILYVDDEQDNLEAFRLSFGEHFEVVTATSGDDALKLLERRAFAVLLSDERMPGMSGIELLERASKSHPDTSRLIVSGYSDPDRLLRAISQGQVHDYVLKPWQRDDLERRMRHGIEQFERRTKLTRLAEAHGAEQQSHGAEDAFVGLEPLRALAKKAAQSDATVLIRGETGTGKEIVARWVHAQSARCDGPFVRVNCGALSEGLLESELFGHEQGAFTGAGRMRKGRFELADGGTIFLDEIGDISAKMQVSLLRALQEREIERVGGANALRVDVRVIAATHRPLERLVAEGGFREDLFFRLNVIPLELPPLRERPKEIVPLLAHFLGKHARGGRVLRVSDEATNALERYRWPGNVRELENLVMRALALCDPNDAELGLDDFCLRFDLPSESEAAGRNVREEAEAVRAEELRALLLQHGGNVTRAAKELGVARTTLFSQARKLGLL